jgi:hypothetical protein
MIFGLNVEIYKPRKTQTVLGDGTVLEKIVKGRCSHCGKQLKGEVMIVTQTYRTKFGRGVHKFCPSCSEAGMRELKAATKDIKFRASIGWDNY